MMKDRRWTVCRGDAKQSVIPRHGEKLLLYVECVQHAALQHCSTAALQRRVPTITHHHCTAGLASAGAG